MSSDVLSLYLNLKEMRQREEQSRVAQERAAANERHNALAQAIEYGIKTEDEAGAIGVFDALTKYGMGGDYDILRSAVKSAKKRNKAAELAAERRGTGFGDVARGGAPLASDPEALQQYLGGLIEIGALSPELAGPAVGRIQALSNVRAGNLDTKRLEQGIQTEGFAQRRAIANQDTVFSVRDTKTGEVGNVIGLDALRAARMQNPGLIVTGKPTAIGTSEEVFGSPTKNRVAQLEDDMLHFDQAVEDMEMAVSLLETNPALGGFIGTVTRGVGGGWQTLQELTGAGSPMGSTVTELADEALGKVREDIASGRMDAKAGRDFLNALTDPSAPALDVLGSAITYGYARALRGEGKLTVDDKERAEKSVGIRTGVLTSSKQANERLKFALKRIKRQRDIAKKRLDFKAKKYGGATEEEGGTLVPLDQPPEGGFDIDLMGE